MVDMIACPVITEPPVMPELRRFSVDEYVRMADAGIFNECEHIELLEGVILQMAPIGSRHAACVSDLIEILVTRLAGRARVNSRSTLRLAIDSAPEPDLVLLRPREDHYRNAIATAADVLMLIEVSHSTLRFDRDVKLPLYARAGIPEVWIVDVERARVLVYRKPTAQGYEQSLTARGDDLLAPELFPDSAIKVSEFVVPPEPAPTPSEPC